MPGNSRACTKSSGISGYLLRIRSSTYVHPQLYVCLLRIRSYMISGYLLRTRSYIYVCNTGQRQSVHQVVRDIGISAAHPQLPVHPLVCNTRIV